MNLSSGTLVLGVFAVLFGLAGAHVARQQLAGPPVTQTAAGPEDVELVAVPMAAVDLPAGRTLTTTDILVRRLTWQQIRTRELPREFMNQVSQLTGRTLRAEVPKGSPFAPEDLYPEGTGPSVAERLKPGFRAVPVTLDGSQAELGLLSPGVGVDVLFRTFDSDAVPETTVVLLEAVEVLAIGEQTFPGVRANAVGGGRRTPAVTLACTPAQAAALKVVEGRGAISLVLRGPDDHFGFPGPAPRTLESLLDLPQPPQPVTTQIYRRGRVTTTVFEDGQQVAVTEGFSKLPIPADTGPAGMPSVLRDSESRERTFSLRVPAGEPDSPCDGCGSDSPN